MEKEKTNTVIWDKRRRWKHRIWDKRRRGKQIIWDKRRRENKEYEKDGEGKNKEYEKDGEGKNKEYCMVDGEGEKGMILKRKDIEKEILYIEKRMILKK